MKLYALDSADTARACRLLIRQWSDTIRDVPDDVLDGIETVQGYAESRLSDFCAQGKFLRELTEDEESLWHQWSKSSESLRRSMGSGVVLAGEETQAVQEVLGHISKAAFLLESLSRGQNLVLI